MNFIYLDCLLQLGPLELICKSQFLVGQKKLDGSERWLESWTFLITCRCVWPDKLSMVAQWLRPISQWEREVYCQCRFNFCGINQLRNIKNFLTQKLVDFNYSWLLKSQFHVSVQLMSTSDHTTYKVDIKELYFPFLTTLLKLYN